MKKSTILFFLFPIFIMGNNQTGVKSTKPEIIQIQDNLMRVLYSYKESEDLSTNLMIAPKGWTEPFVKCEFKIQGMVLNGKLGLETEKGILIISEKEGFLIPKNTKVRIHNAGDSELRIIEILRPAYKKSLVTKYPLGK
ncbi:MAG: hypothetical protein HON84_09200 [Candidatus Marinimicrobia bacterium]|nr:hypothetical protein [Candidatus Neomarinimicrobiota bacterium]MBT4067831.1 hypothetical protein [Candidatus Neomarinimicrobiota bacterium]MBT4810086.1 hypothetical protein [Candidatus Neomarinimicrobiota bacterium]MBT5176695.1 hypothetical protein [Candidatus Neomarinimicrobiota bacterium]